MDLFSIEYGRQSCSVPVNFCSARSVKWQKKSQKISPSRTAELRNTIQGSLISKGFTYWGKSSRIVGRNLPEFLEADSLHAVRVKASHDSRNTPRDLGVVVQSASPDLFDELSIFML